MYSNWNALVLKEIPRGERSIDCESIRAWSLSIFLYIQGPLMSSLQSKIIYTEGENSHSFQSTASLYYSFFQWCHMLMGTTQKTDKYL